MSKLEELELWEERRYFLAVEDMVLYIVHKNSLDPHFGHCNFAVEQLNFYVELLKANLGFYTNNVPVDDEKFKIHRNPIKTNITIIGAYSTRPYTSLVETSPKRSCMES